MLTLKACSCMPLLSWSNCIQFLPSHRLHTEGPKLSNALCCLKECVCMPPANSVTVRMHTTSNFTSTAHTLSEEVKHYVLLQTRGRATTFCGRSGTHTCPAARYSPLGFSCTLQRMCRVRQSFASGLKLSLFTLTDSSLFQAVTRAAEYQSGSAVFVAKIKKLETMYKSIRRARGDGNCFFRSFIFAYMESLVHTADLTERNRFALSSFC